MRNALLCATVAGLLAGCSLVPEIGDLPSPVAKTWPTGAAYAAPAMADASAVADLGWTEVFLSPDLRRLIAKAIDNNRDLRVAVLNVEAARAAYRVTGANLYPQLDASASRACARTTADLISSGRAASTSTDNRPRVGSAERDGSSSATYDVKLGVAAVKDFGVLDLLNVEASHNVMKGDAEYDTASTAANKQDSSGIRYQETETLRFQVKANLFDGLLDNTFAASRMDSYVVVRSKRDVNAVSRYFGDLEKYEYQGTLRPLDNQTFTFGADAGAVVRQFRDHDPEARGIAGLRYWRRATVAGRPFAA